MAETITLDDLEDLNLEELQELVLTKQEEYADLKSNSTKGAQQLLDEKKLLEKAIKLSINDESLAQLRETDPELAEKISQQLASDPSDTSKVTSQNVGELVEQEIAKREISQKYDKVISQLNEEEQELFKKEYDELVEWKKLTPEKADKFIKLALNTLSDNSSSDVDYAKSIWLWWSNVSSKSKSNKQSSDEKRVAYAKEYR